MKHGNENSDTAQGSLREIIAKQGRLVYTNVGISMMPLLRERRDLLIIGPPPEGRLKLWDIPLYQRDGDVHKYVLHRVLWVRKNDYIICGDNQWRPETGITDRHIVGVLEAVSRDGKLLPVRATSEHPHVPLGYKLYVWTWCIFFPIRAAIVALRQKSQVWYYRILRHLARKKHSAS